MVIIIIVIKLIDTNPLNLGTYSKVAKVLPYACLNLPHSSGYCNGCQEMEGRGLSGVGH